MQFDNADCSTCGCTGIWIADQNVFCCGSCGDVYEATEHEVLQSQINRFYLEMNVAGKLEKQHPAYENGECVTCGEGGIWIADHGAFCCLTCGDSYRIDKDEMLRDQIKKSFHSKLAMQKKCEHEDAECLTCGGNGIWVAEHEAFICDVCGDVYEASEHEVVQIQIQAFDRKITSRKLKQTAHESVDCTTCGEIGIWIAEHGVFCCQTCGEYYDATAAEILKRQISNSFHKMMSSPYQYSDYENAACSTCGCTGIWIAEHEEFCCGTCGDVYEATGHEILQSQIQSFSSNSCEINGPKINGKEQPDYDSAECNTCGQTGIWIAEHDIFSCGSCGDCYGASRHDIRMSQLQKFFDRNLSDFRPAINREYSPPFSTDTANSVTQYSSPRCHLSLNKIVANGVRTSKKSGVQQICPRVLNYSIRDASSSAVSPPNQSSLSIPQSHDHNSFTTQTFLMQQLEYQLQQLEYQLHSLVRTQHEPRQIHQHVANNTINEDRTVHSQKKNTRIRKVHARYKKCENVYLQWLGSVTTISSPVRSASELIGAAKKLHHDINHGYVVDIPESVMKSLNDAIRLRKKVSKDKGHLHWLRALQQCRNHLIQSQKVLQQKRNPQSQKGKKKQRKRKAKELVLCR